MSQRVGWTVFCLVCISLLASPAAGARACKDRVRLSLRIQSHGSAGARSLHDGDTVVNNERLVLFVRPGRQVYIYLIARAADGTPVLHLPEGSSIRLRAGREERLPRDEDPELSFNDVPGQEELTLVASVTPVPQPLALVGPQHPPSGRAAGTQAEEFSARTKSLLGEGRGLQKSPRVVPGAAVIRAEGCGRVVYRLVLRHERAAP